MASPFWPRTQPSGDTASTTTQAPPAAAAAAVLQESCQLSQLRDVAETASQFIHSKLTLCCSAEKLPYSMAVRQTAADLASMYFNTEYLFLQQYAAAIVLQGMLHPVATYVLRETRANCMLLHVHVSLCLVGTRASRSTSSTLPVTRTLVVKLSVC